MAYYYVKFGGTATGTVGYSSPKTGSWSAAFTNTNQYYNDLYAVLYAISESSTDFILLSDEHVYDYPSSGTRTYASSVIGLKIISVDDDDVTIPSPGATEILSYIGSSSCELNLYFNYIYGVVFQVSTSFNVDFSSTYLTYPVLSTYEKCTLLVEGTNNYDKYITSSRGSNFIDCVFSFNVIPTSYLYDFKFTNSYGKKVSFTNCSFISPSSSSVSLFRQITFPQNLTFEGCDFTQCNRPLLTEYASASNKNLHRVSFIRCKESSNSRLNKVGAGYIVPTGFYFSGENKFLSDQYYMLGRLESTTSIYRSDGAEYLNSLFTSFKVTPNSTLVNSVNPFYFKLADLYTDTTNSITFTVEIAQDNAVTALTEYDMALDVFYIDSSSPKLLYKSSVNHNLNFTDLPTSSKTWVGLTNPTKQYLSVTTSETGSYGLCSIYLSVFNPNITLYVCPKVDIT
jgi:hypothetical protein